MGIVGIYFSSVLPWNDPSTRICLTIFSWLKLYIMAYPIPALIVLAMGLHRQSGWFSLRKAIWILLDLLRKQSMTSIWLSWRYYWGWQIPTLRLILGWIVNSERQCEGKQHALGKSAVFHFPRTGILKFLRKYSTPIKLMSPRNIGYGHLYLIQLQWLGLTNPIVFPTYHPPTPGSP